MKKIDSKYFNFQCFVIPTVKLVIYSREKNNNDSINNFSSVSSEMSDFDIKISSTFFWATTQKTF